MPRRPHIKKLDLYGVVDTGSSDPASGEQGELFYNTTDSALKVYLSGIWTSISGGVVAVIARLVQNGDYRVDQAGNYRIDQSQ